MLVLYLSFLIALLDQITKYLIQRNLLSGHITVIPGLLDLRHVRNTGAAWGILEGFNNWLIVLSVLMLIVIVVYRRSLLTDAPSRCGNCSCLGEASSAAWDGGAGAQTHRIAMGLMIGGIVGNLVDRLRLACVVDFLDFYWGPHHFPAFNVADSAICVGVGLYVISQIMSQKRAESRPACSRPVGRADRE